MTHFLNNVMMDLINLYWDSWHCCCVICQSHPSKSAGRANTVTAASDWLACNLGFCSTMLGQQSLIAKYINFTITINHIKFFQVTLPY